MAAPDDGGRAARERSGTERGRRGSGRIGSGRWAGGQVAAERSRNWADTGGRTSVRSTGGGGGGGGAAHVRAARGGTDGTRTKNNTRRDQSSRMRVAPRRQLFRAGAGTEPARYRTARPAAGAPRARTSARTTAAAFRYVAFRVVAVARQPVRVPATAGAGPKKPKTTRTAVAALGLHAA